MAYRADIDGLRAIAVLAVLLFHAGVPGFSGGYVGVDVFFVISGYLITSIIVREVDEDRFSLARFYERRARRILPALFLVVTASVAVGAVMLSPQAFADLGRSTFATSLFVSNVYFYQATSDYFARASDFMPLLHTWSLAVEEQFYFAFPLVLMVIGRRGRGLRLGIVGGLCAASFAASLVLVPQDQSFAFFLPFTRAWELGVGSLLALSNAGRSAGRRSREVVGWTGLAAVVLSVTVMDGQTPFPGVSALPVCLGTAAMIWSGQAGSGTAIGRVLSMRVMLFFGAISYSLYLWHWPILAYLRTYLNDAHLPIALALSGLAIATLLSWASVRLVEDPIRHAARRPRAVGTRMVLGSAGLATGAFAVLGAGLVLTAGLPQRLPSDVLAVYQSAYRPRDAHASCFRRNPVRDGFCRFGASDRTGTDVLLWGDSHADALLPSVVTLTERAGVSGTFMGLSACPPLPGLQRRGDPAGADCAAFNADVLRYVLSRDDLRTVIIHARWPLAVEGGWAGRGDSQTVVLDLATDARDGAPQGNAPRVAWSLEDAVGRLRASGRRVVLLGPVPELDYALPEELANSLLYGRPMPKGPLLSGVEARQSRSEAILRRVAARTGAEYVPLTPALCARDCAVLSASGEPLYRDQHHVRPVASEEFLTPYLQPRLGLGEIRSVQGS